MALETCPLQPACLELLPEHCNQHHLEGLLGYYLAPCSCHHPAPHLCLQEAALARPSLVRDCNRWLAAFHQNCLNRCEATVESKGCE